MLSSSRLPGLVAGVAALALVAGCSTGPVAEVTRFNLGQPIPRDTVALEPRNTADTGSLAFASVAAGVGAEFAAIGFAAAPPASAAYIGVVGIEETTRSGPPRGPRASIGLGGGVGGRNGGVGGGVSVPVAGSGTGEVRQTVLSIRLRRRSDATTVWEGRAVQDRAARGDPGIAAVAPALARALLSDFPGSNGQTVRVKTR